MLMQQEKMLMCSTWFLAKRASEADDDIVKRRSQQKQHQPLLCQFEFPPPPPTSQKTQLTRHFLCWFFSDISLDQKNIVVIVETSLINNLMVTKPLLQEGACCILGQTTIFGTTYNSQDSIRKVRSTSEASLKTQTEPFQRIPPLPSSFIT